MGHRKHAIPIFWRWVLNQIATTLGIFLGGTVVGVNGKRTFKKGQPLGKLHEFVAFSSCSEQIEDFLFFCGDQSCSLPSGRGTVEVLLELLFQILEGHLRLL